MTQPNSPVSPPSHLPDKLRICLWDFSWYTQTMPGEPFHDLDAAFGELVDRGYNTIRICAAPLLLFGEHRIDTSALRFAAIGDSVGQGTRWYNVRGGAVLNLKEYLLELFKAARRHDVFVIVSSWEYQQSPAFLDTPVWHEAITSIPPGQRHQALAEAEVRLLDFLREHGLLDRVAYIEVHNEVDLSRLTEVVGAGEDTFHAQKPYLEKALAILQDAYPEVLSTACYGIPPYLDLTSMPENAQVAHHHFYVYGVLGALEDWAKVRATPPLFPTPELKTLLRDDAPDFDSWAGHVEPWRLAATGISLSMFYTYDWVDPVKWDDWLYRHYQAHAAAMQERVSVRLRAVATWARQHGVPAVIGEGWIGYTPLEAEFEDGPAGQEFALQAVRLCAQLGYWGTLPGSNSAPHHPSGWRNVDFQRRANRLFAPAPQN
ncbi:cellulase-like family protein [Sinomonas sp. JGH33]|uniref:Cellulase-like family protein n=1 Tax=Sinomonas terricola TaxID=3110330 RepID=A0ABU5TBK9_9MICC|nr:cellulase-like family protein [Sinomonas sp. JGH33]MEA5457083.1 cellulase-like family protein [Sinomonas sp. JGH33]